MIEVNDLTKRVRATAESSRRWRGETQRATTAVLDDTKPQGLERALRIRVLGASIFRVE